LDYCDKDDDNNDDDDSDNDDDGAGLNVISDNQGPVQGVW